MGDGHGAVGDSRKKIWEARSLEDDISDTLDEATKAQVEADALRDEIKANSLLIQSYAARAEDADDERDALRAAVAARIEFMLTEAKMTDNEALDAHADELLILLDDSDAALRVVKAQALREAADAEEGRCTGDWNGTVCDSCKATAQRLRDRADRIEGGADDE